MLSSGAFNALLKILEEPPEHVLFILATTELQKVPATILSRCQRFDFRRIGAEDIAQRLLYIAEQESIPLTEGASRLIARLADGAMRDALSMLDRAATVGAIDEETAAAALGVLGQDDAMKLAESLKRQDLAQAVNLLGEYYNAGRDLAGVYNQLLDLIWDALLVKTSDGNCARISALLSPAYSATQLDALCDGLSASALLEWSEIISRTLDRMRKTANRRMEAELCAVRLCTIEAVPDRRSSNERMEASETKTKQNVSVVAPPLAPEPQTPTTTGKTLENPPQQQPWSQWNRALEMIKTKLGASAYSLLESARVILEKDTLFILCADTATETILRTPKYSKVIRKIMKELDGRKVAIRLTGDALVFSEQSVNALRERAKALFVLVRTEGLL